MTDPYVIRACGFGGPASMQCPVHRKAVILRFATESETAIILKVV